MCPPCSRRTRREAVRPANHARPDVRNAKFTEKDILLRMQRMVGLLRGLVAGLIGLSACTGGPSTSGSSDGEARDGGVPDRGAVVIEGCDVGRACGSDADCPAGECTRERRLSLPVRGLPDGRAVIETRLFPGGSCAPDELRPIDDARACDPLAPKGQQGCTACSRCVPLIADGEAQTICRARCVPRADASGCARPGYTCDRALRVCLEACQSDAECRAFVSDEDGDGQPDVNRYDSGSRAVCSDRTGRCRRPGRIGARAGDSCERHSQCEPGGRCLPADGSLGGFGLPGGYCTKEACDLPGFECAGSETVCASVRSYEDRRSRALCLRRCTTGAEPEPARLGPGGHGAGCRDGYMCLWNGRQARQLDGNGVCVGGNYNSVEEPNIGAACDADSACYSPFGHGLCSMSWAAGDPALPGVCTVVDCAAPGMPADLCGPDAVCASLGHDRTACLSTCASAADCARGMVCTDDDGVAGTPRLCFPPT